MKFKDLYITKIFLYIYRNFFEKQPLFLFLLVAVILNLSCWFLVSLKGRPENYIIPLHYLTAKGVDKTGSWLLIYKIPFIASVVLFLNFFIAFKWNQKDAKASYVLGAATDILEIFFVIASLLVVFKI